MKTADKIRSNKKMREHGQVIVCPKCNGEVTVFNVNWVALACLHCKYATDRKKWLVKEDKQ